MSQVRLSETLDPSTMEFSVYAFLKLHVYESLHRAGAGRPGSSLQPSVIKPFSAHRVHRLMTGATGKTFVDFFDLSSYFVRNRLQNLNHGTVLLQTGRGFRNSVKYKWNESVDASTYQSYAQLRSLLAGNLGVALDVLRLFSAFGGNSFTRDQFLTLFRTHRDEFVERRWYKIATRIPSNSLQYTQFILGRLEELLGLGLVVQDQGSMRLAPLAREVHQWMELFLYSARYPQSTAAVSPPLASAEVLQ